MQKLLDDVGRLDERVGRLNRHFDQTVEDIRQIRITTDKVTKRAERIDEIQLGPDSPTADLPPPVPAIAAEMNSCNNDMATRFSCVISYWKSHGAGATATGSGNHHRGKLMDIVISEFSIFVVAVLILAVIIVMLGVKAVSQGYEYTVERFGRYTRTLKPGCT